MHAKLPLGWPDASEPRYEEKRAALSQIALCPAPEWDAEEVMLPLNTADPLAAARAVVDSLRILGATDLELCFWPPATAVSHEEARLALELLRPCTERRALLSARRALLAAVDASRKSGAVEQEMAFTSVLDQVQHWVDAYCASSFQCKADRHAVEEAPKGADMTPSLDMSAHGGVWAHPSLRAREVPGRGCGIVATSRITGGEETLLPLCKLEQKLCRGVVEMSRELATEYLHGSPV